MPDNSEVTAHTANVLRLASGSQIPEGDWVWGGSCVGSVMTAVEVMKWCGVHQAEPAVFFSIRALNAVIKARFDKRPASYWITFTLKFQGCT
jgi:hypothetical protein